MKLWSLYVFFTSKLIIYCTITYKGQYVFKNFKVTEEGTNSQIPVVGNVFDANKEFYTINLSNMLTVGNNYTIYIEFVSKVNEVSPGLHRSSYLAEDGTTR